MMYNMKQPSSAVVSVRQMSVKNYKKQKIVTILKKTTCIVYCETYLNNDTHLNIVEVVEKSDKCEELLYSTAKRWGIFSTLATARYVAILVEFA